MKITHLDGGVAIAFPDHSPHNSMQAVGITVETHDASFQLQSNESLLDALIRTGHDVDYQCRSGYCGSCRTKKISGEVEYDEYPLAHLNDDEILPCYCRAKSALKLDICRRYEDDERQGELFDEWR